MSNELRVIGREPPEPEASPREELLRFKYRFVVGYAWALTAILIVGLALWAGFWLAKN